MSRNNNNNNNQAAGRPGNNDRQDDTILQHILQAEPLLADVIQRVGNLAQEAYVPIQRVIPFDQNGQELFLERLRVALEAAGLNVDAAARLFWDDFVAHNEMQQQVAAAAQQIDNAAAVAAGAAINDANLQLQGLQFWLQNNGMMQQNQQLQMLQQQQQQQQQQQAPPQPPQPNAAALALRNLNMQVNNDNMMIANNNNFFPLPPQPPEGINNDNDDLDDDDIMADDGNMFNVADGAPIVMQARESVPRLPLPPPPEALQANDESINVSDDEDRYIMRILGKQPSGSKNRKKRKSDVNKITLIDTSDTPKKKRKFENDVKDSGAFIGDNDWIWDSIDDRAEVPLCEPCNLLWGTGAPPVTAVATAEASTKDNGGGMTEEGSENAKVKEETGSGNDNAANNEANNNGNNEHANANPNEDENNNNNNNNNNNAAAGGEGEDDTGNNMIDKNKPGIPFTWLSAGFSMALGAVGLAVKPPKEEDYAYLLWQQNTAKVRNSSLPNIPPPYHCKSITALLSIVTGLIYTGVSIQLEEVTCKSCKEPFAELDDEQKRRQFNIRLVDALSSLLLIAAKSSIARKRKALEYLKTSSDPADVRKWQKLQHKLKLVPICTWDVDPTSKELRINKKKPFGQSLSIVTSYTHIQDLRSFVLSHLQLFTGAGGCALFLETLFHIHGEEAVEYLLKESCKKSGLKEPAHCHSFVNCTCDERFMKDLEDNHQPSRSRSELSKINDTTPTGTSCVSIELLSLILTGKVNSTYTDWSSGPLELGIISNKAGEMCRALTRPPQPVWLLRGPTCYSLTWSKKCHDGFGTLSQGDKEGLIAQMEHWNPWYGIRNATKYRLVTAREEWRAPVVSFSTADYEDETYTGKAPRIVSQSCLNGMEEIKADDVFSAQEIEDVVANADDKKYYPNKYRMWRFRIEDKSSDAMDTTSDLGGKDQDWIPFYRLGGREKQLVETKLGPQIKTVLWTRWPKAKIDDFAPLIPAPIV